MLDLGLTRRCNSGVGMAMEKSDCAGGSCASPVLAGALGWPALGYKPTGIGAQIGGVDLILPACSGLGVRLSTSRDIV